MQSASKILKGILLFSLISGFCFTDTFAAKEVLSKEEVDELGQDLLDAARLEHFKYVEDNIKDYVQNGGDVNIVNTGTYSDGIKSAHNTLLYYAFFHGKYLLAKYLIENGADIYKENVYKNTPMEACCGRIKTHIKRGKSRKEVLNLIWFLFNNKAGIINSGYCLLKSI